jgi:hypothetical protein
MRRLDPQYLWQLRNKVSIAIVLQSHLGIPCKHREGFLRFLCPECNQSNTAVNPNTNLARCFTCKKNFNTIDLVIRVIGCSFLDAVKSLSMWLPK